MGGQGASLGSAPIPVGGTLGGGGALAGPAAPVSAAPLRGPTSRTFLQIDWKYPSYKPETKTGSGDSVAVEVRRALPVEKAYPVLSGSDPRPLLVLRECLFCNGTDDALLTRGADNDKTFLMAKWFQCVKLPPAVSDADHPLHELFPGENPGHLFLARADGTMRYDLTGQQSRTELWKAMENLLKEEYAKKSGPVLKDLLGAMDDLDEVDARLIELRSQLEDAIEDDGPNSRDAKKLRKKVAALVDEKNELVAEVNELQLLPLRDPEPKTSGTDTESEEEA